MHGQSSVVWTRYLVTRWSNEHFCPFFVSNCVADLQNEHMSHCCKSMCNHRTIGIYIHVGPHHLYRWLALLPPWWKVVHETYIVCYMSNCTYAVTCQKYRGWNIFYHTRGAHMHARTLIRLLHMSLAHAQQSTCPCITRESSSSQKHTNKKAGSRKVHWLIILLLSWFWTAIHMLYTPKWNLIKILW